MTKKEEFVAHYVMYLDDFFLEDSIESVYPYVDKIIIARTAKPWNGPLADLSETEKTLRIVLDQYGDKIEIYVAEFPDEQTQRNWLINFSKARGHKGAFIIDCDEVFVGNAFEKIYSFIRSNKPKALRIPHHTFVKDASFCIAPPYEDKLFYIDLSCNPQFLWARSINVEQTSMHFDDPQILHFSYLRKTDQDILKKINSFMHAKDADWGEWYRDVYLNFNPEIQNFHPVHPEMWRKVQPFDPGKFPQRLINKLHQNKKLSSTQSEPNPVNTNILATKDSSAEHTIQHYVEDLYISTPTSKNTSLRNTTLCCIDCNNYELSIPAIRHCLQFFEFNKVLFFTDKEFNLENISVVKIPKITTKEQYSLFVLKELKRYIDTDFILIIQWDGFIANPDSWTTEFQNYDYIGAKWFWYSDGFNVGNGGFSLRSKRLLQALSEDTVPVTIESLKYGEDTFICRLYRRLLENKYGIKFAPEAIADKFSYERSEPSDNPFGFHGLFNMWRYVKDEKVEDFIEILTPHVLNSIEAIELVQTYNMLGQKKHALALCRRILKYYPSKREARSLLNVI